MPHNLVTIKQGLDSNIGRMVLITQHTGRKRILKRQGILSDTFPAVFVVELDQEENKVERICYSYRDILTETVAIEFIE